MATRQQLIELLGSGPRRVHFIGIGGVGMSGLARLLLQQGHTVTGCDVSPNGETAQLRELGARIHTGHSAQHLKNGADLVVHTSAVNGGNEELQMAAEAQIPVVRRGHLLSALMNHRINIAVAGTHGKTTTSSMIAHVLTRSDSAPSYCIGASVPVLGGSARIGGGKYFVAETDESDGTLVNYTPEYAVCLNIEPEHLDHHGSLDQLIANFEQFLSSTLKTVFYCADCAVCARLASKLRSAISFGLTPSADYHSTHIEPTVCGTRFTVACRDQQMGTIELRIPGQQNVVNALAAVAVADELGVPFDKIAGALAEFTGARRRFERKFDSGGIVVADDYAHHPTEIRATIAGARMLKPGRVLAAFQPHRYTRVRALREQFATAFAGVDKLWLTDIYAASEKPIEGITGQTLVEAVKATGQTDVKYESDLKTLADQMAREAEQGDLILTMGAGDIYKVAESLAEKLSMRSPVVIVADHQSDAVLSDLTRLVSKHTRLQQDEPMSRHTSLRIGGPAEVWAEPWDERDLGRIVKYCQERAVPLTIIGRGTNLLVRDGGIPGVVAHLGSREFSRVEMMEDGRLMARAGASLRSIVNLARTHEMGGLEFLQGIPGSLGGALRMNAGAMGRQIFEVMDWVRYMSLTGEMYDAVAGALPVSYRSCPVFETHIALCAILRGEKTPRALIEVRLQEWAQRRRATQPSQPSAGCVFKNPAAVSAGKLIEELGLKGTRVGGALVSERHANFIVNTGGARANDVLQLMAIVRERARQERGIELEQEVMILGKDT